MVDQSHEQWVELAIMRIEARTQPCPLSSDKGVK